MCDINGKVSLRGQYTKGVEGTARNVPCYNFGTIAGETVKDFTNIAKNPYEDLENNLEVLTWINDPWKDGQIVYYPEQDGFKLRIRCDGEVSIYQWPKAQFP